MINWNTFLWGEAELECESIEDAETLLEVCEENNISFYDIDESYYEYEPYWSVRGNSLYNSRYVCDSDEICSCWTVKEYVENHTH